MMRRRFALILGLCLLSTGVRADIQTLLQLVDYMGVDYPEAVQDGTIVNRFEYAEMVEFADNIRNEINQLEVSPAKTELLELSADLIVSVNTLADPAVVAGQTSSMRQIIMSGFDMVLTPLSPPDLQQAEQIYMTQCASCHGETGRGDGPASMGLEPPPTDFHDIERARQRSLYGLYNTITLGVEGTSMPARPDLTDEERWSLAFYVGSLMDLAGMEGEGEAAWHDAPLTLNEAVTLSPFELSQDRSGGEALGFWVRQNADSLFAGGSEPLQVSRELLAASLQSYMDGDTGTARQQAITAYLEGFELVEAPLSNVDAGLMRRAEAGLIAYRQGINDGVSPDELQTLYNNALTLLNESEQALSGDALSPTVAFSGSLIILLREGLEIILVLAAIITLLIRSNRADALKYVHAGWIAALLAGAGTWAVSSYIFTISGATREVTEGITALVAAAILLYVGYWMHRNANTRRWNQYLTSKVKTALTARTLWTLAIVSFLAVYREIFEIILFYQALWAQVNTEAHNAVFYGAVLAAVLLGLTTWLIFKFGMKLPIKQFFTFSAILLVTLAFIFTGKGIAALQEAGRVSISPVPGPTIDLLGIYPNLQVLVTQALVVLLTIGVFIYDKKAKSV